MNVLYSSLIGAGIGFVVGCVIGTLRYTTILGPDPRMAPWLRRRFGNWIGLSVVPAIGCALVGAVIGAFIGWIF